MCIAFSLLIMQALKNHSKNPDFNKNPEGNLGILFFLCRALYMSHSDAKINHWLILRKLMSLVNLAIILSNLTNFPKFSVLR